ncbi:alpha/beta hydrolase [Pedobacter sp. P351]|uniref:alpha/beta hydrolase n=1 Tax=Pedobacter superstes TaxID=3133441 RepID=UPI003096A410
MKWIIVIMFGLLFQKTVVAQDLVMPLWPKGKVPNYVKTADFEKRDTGKVIKIQMVQFPDIAIYIPTRQTSTKQAVIICPGGGYGGLSYNLEGTDPAGWLISKGVTAIVLKYRLPNSQSNITPHLSPLMDVKRAFRIVRANAGLLGINKDAIGVMGFSAGGHLASTLATHFDEGNHQSVDSIERESCKPNFAILVYPVISMTKQIMHAGSRDNLIGTKASDTLAQFYSSELNVSKNTPPTFLLHAMDDGAVPVENSLLFFQALKDNGVPGELHVFPKGGHGFGLGLGKGDIETWPELCIRWLRSLKAK